MKSLSSMFVFVFVFVFVSVFVFVFVCASMTNCLENITLRPITPPLLCVSGVISAKTVKLCVGCWQTGTSLFCVQNWHCFFSVFWHQLYLEIISLKCQFHDLQLPLLLRSTDYSNLCLCLNVYSYLWVLYHQNLRFPYFVEFHNSRLPLRYWGLMIGIRGRCGYLRGARLNYAGADKHHHNKHTYMCSSLDMVYFT